MNKLPKRLSINEAREIFSELHNLEVMAHQLGNDVERGSRELAANSSDQFWRRNLVRIFAAYVEGYSFLLKQVVLRLHDPLQKQLSVEEQSKLKEIWLDAAGQTVLDNQGAAKRRFLRFHDNLKFAVTMFSRLCDSEYAVVYGSAGYEAFRRTVSVRDRLMHPKAIEDLDVTASETSDLHVASNWYQSEMLALLKDSTNALNQRFATIPGPKPGSPS